jgi:hypothetical protein
MFAITAALTALPVHVVSIAHESYRNAVDVIALFEFSHSRSMRQKSASGSSNSPIRPWMPRAIHLDAPGNTVCVTRVVGQRAQRGTYCAACRWLGVAAITTGESMNALALSLLGIGVLLSACTSMTENSSSVRTSEAATVQGQTVPAPVDHEPSASAAESPAGKPSETTACQSGTAGAPGDPCAAPANGPGSTPEGATAPPPHESRTQQTPNSGQAPAPEPR